MSHAKAAWRIVQDEVDVGLIVEDDVAFHVAAGPMMGAVRDWLVDASPGGGVETGLGIVNTGYLPYSFGGLYQTDWFDTPSYEGHWGHIDVRWPNVGPPFGMIAYLVTRAAADVIAGALNRPRIFDVRMDMKRRGMDNVPLVIDCCVSPKLVMKGFMRPQVSTA